MIWGTTTQHRIWSTAVSLSGDCGRSCRSWRKAAGRAGSTCRLHTAAAPLWPLRTLLRVASHSAATVRGMCFGVGWRGRAGNCRAAQKPPELLADTTQSGAITQNLRDLPRTHRMSHFDHRINKICHINDTIYRNFSAHRFMLERKENWKPLNDSLRLRSELLEKKVIHTFSFRFLQVSIPFTNATSCNNSTTKFLRSRSQPEADVSVSFDGIMSAGSTKTLRKFWRFPKYW